MGNALGILFKKKNIADSFSIPQNFFLDTQENSIFIPKMKSGIKTVFHRSLKNVIKTNSLVISKSASGKYFVAINVQEKVSHRKPVTKVNKDTKTIGIDLGIKDFLVESSGAKISSPKFLKASEKRLKQAQRRLSRKKKGSNNRSKQRTIVARIHEKVANQRNNFIHSQSKRLINENQVIYLETLNVSGMIKNRHLSKAISDCGWSEFVRQLKYKANWHGVVIYQIGRWEPSSKLCSTIGCDYKNVDLQLSDRIWTCPQCNSTHDRDINAAKNIEQIGLEAPELTPVEKSAAVFSIIPYASAKAHCTGQTQKIQAASAKQELKASS